MDYVYYMERQKFLKNRNDALRLISYLIGFWEIKQDEVDFEE